MDLCFNSYVYLEYPNEAAVEEAVTNYKNVEMNGQILYVIKTVTEKKESFGESFESCRVQDESAFPWSEVSRVLIYHVWNLEIAYNTSMYYIAGN